MSEESDLLQLELLQAELDRVIGLMKGTGCYISNDEGYLTVKRPNAPGVDPESLLDFMDGRDIECYLDIEGGQIDIPVDPDLPGMGYSVDAEIVRVNFDMMLRVKVSRKNSGGA